MKGVGGGLDEYPHLPESMGWVGEVPIGSLAGEAPILRLMLLYFEHIMRRHDSRQETRVLGKVESNRRNTDCKMV